MKVETEDEIHLAVCIGGFTMLMIFATESNFLALCFALVTLIWIGRLIFLARRAGQESTQEVLSWKTMNGKQDLKNSASR